MHRTFIARRIRQPELPSFIYPQLLPSPSFPQLTTRMSEYVALSPSFVLVIASVDEFPASLSIARFISIRAMWISIDRVVFVLGSSFRHLSIHRLSGDQAALVRDSVLSADQQLASIIEVQVWYNSAFCPFRHQGPFVLRNQHTRVHVSRSLNQSPKTPGCQSIPRPTCPAPSPHSRAAVRGSPTPLPPPSINLIRPTA